MSFDLNFILALLIVLTIHEFSHAWVANFLGDPTAKLSGRLSLNPLAHLDLVGTLMLLFVHIGWGKPVPVNPSYFSHPRRDNSLTALAGPLSNLLLALILTIPIKYFSEFLWDPVLVFFNTLWQVSIYLCAFNLLPFPPLDGSKIIGIFIPIRFQAAYNRYLNNGMIYFALFVLFDQFFLWPTFRFSILQFFLGSMMALFKTILFLGS